MRTEQKIARVQFLSQDDLLDQISRLNPVRVLSVDYDVIMTEQERREGKSVAIVHYLVPALEDDF